jgi:Tol biopolymer transport system component
MTVDDRLTRRVESRLDELADAHFPDYVHDVLAVTARMRQRPAWSFPARWLAMELRPTRVAVAPFPWRSIALLALLALAGVALAVALASTRPRLPEPFGPAANGIIAFARNGDIFVVDGVDDQPRALVAGPDDDGMPIFSPDGTRLLFVRTVRHNPYLMVVPSDGGDPIEVLREPLIEPTSFVWSPDSRSIAIASMVRASPRISIAAADGGGARVLKLGMIVDSPAWRPPDGRELLVRERNADGVWDLVRVDIRTGTVQPLGLGRAEATRAEEGLVADERLRNAAWSADGELIAYEAIDEARGGTTRLRQVDGEGKARLVHVVSADGTGDRVVDGSAPEIEQLLPRWSPDGSRLLVAQRRALPNRPADEWWWGVVETSGGRIVGLGSRVSGREGRADWAPDGTRVISIVGRPWLDPQAEHTVSLIDPVSGEEVEANWASTDQPAWQRLAP